MSISPEMIAKRLKIIEDLKDELDVVKTNYDAMLEDDPQYQEFQEKQSKIKDEIKNEKQKILSVNNTYMGLQEQIKEKRREIKENKEALGQELAEYYRESGNLEVVDQYGDVKKMKFSVKLIS